MRNSLKNFFKTPHGSAFRTDIAGIRGIAVMIVTLCHFEIPGFGGGFIGPDIFFVLSGYLITGLLIKEYNKNISKRSGRGKISLSAFYLRRTRRIFPASLFVLLCVNIYARFNMNVLQLAQLKTDSLWTALFGANINFLRQATDYFAQNNAVSPLQHYWSLSVEEQFYFVWPVLFLTAASFHKLTIRGREVAWEGRLRAVFIGLGITSFVWMLIEFTNTPTTAYFSTFSRAWELAIGGILSLLSIESLAAKLGRTWTILRGLALVAMVGSIAIVTPANFGYTLWIPAVATGFLLISGPVAKDDVVYRLLSIKPLTALGAISFSLYLWHWPVFVFGRNLELMDSLAQRVVGVFVCIGLGTLSYWLIERTFLRIPLPTLKPRPNFDGRAGFAASRAFTTATTVLVIAGLGAVTYPSNASTGAGQATAWVPPASAASYAPDADTTSTPTAPVETVNLADWTKKIEDATKQTKLSPSELQQVQKDINQSLLSGKSGNCDTQAVASLVNSKTSRQSLDCQWGVGQDAAKYRVVLLGDSFSDAFTPAVLGSFDLSTVNVRMINRPSCRTSFVVDAFDDKAERRLCEQHYQYAYSQIDKEHPDLVINAEAAGGSPVGYMQAKKTSLAKLRKLTDKLVILGTQPTRQAGQETSTCFGASGDIKTQCLTSPRDKSLVRATQKQVAGLVKADYVNPVGWMCTTAICPPFIDGKAVFADYGHYSQSFAALIAPYFADQLRSFGIKYLVGSENEPAATGPGTSTSQFEFSKASFLKDWEKSKREGLKVTSIPDKLEPAYASLNKLAQELWLNCEGYMPPSALGTHVCQAGNPTADNHAVLLGDSHARVLWPSLLASLDLTKWNVTMLAEGNCTFSNQKPVAVFDYNKHCAEHRAYTLDYVRKHKPSVVVVSDSIQPRMDLAVMRKGYVKSFERIKGFASNVLLVTAVPGSAKLSDCVTSDGSLKKCPLVKFPAQSPGQAAQVSVAKQFDYGVLDMNQVLCVSDKVGFMCPSIINSTAVYLDASHLSVPLAKAIAPYFAVEWQKMHLSATLGFAS